MVLSRMVLLSLTLAGLVACESDHPAARAGAALDRAGTATGNAVGDAGVATGNALDRAGSYVKKQVAPTD